MEEGQIDESNSVAEVSIQESVGELDMMDIAQIVLKRLAIGLTIALLCSLVVYQVSESVLFELEVSTKPGQQLYGLDSPYRKF